MTSTVLEFSPRFTLSADDRHEITLIQQEARGISFEHAQLLHEFRNKRRLYLYAPELRLCEALEERIAHAKAELAIPPLRTNGNDGRRNPSPRPTSAPAAVSMPPIDPAPSQPPDVVDAAGWHGQPVPPRQWAVLDRAPLRNVTLVSGAGAVGKSTLLLQLSAAHVTGRDWFGSMPIIGPVLYLSAEDDADELHFRTAAIAAHLDVPLSALNGLRFMPLAGKDALLAIPDRAGVIRPTGLFAAVHKIASDLHPANIIIDTAADTFGGRENDRAMVRQYIGLLRGLAIDASAAVMLVSHPSLTGLNTDTGLSGSTAWDASVRARWYFKPIDADNDAPASDPDLRELVIKKNNYGPAGEHIRMRWQNGLFVPIGTPSSLDKLATDRKAEQAFLDLLDRFASQNQTVGPNKGPTYAPAKFAEHPDGKPFGSKKLAAAMQRLLDARAVPEKAESGIPTRWRI
jgi:hypothetical protein